MRFAIVLLILLALASIGAVILGEIFPPADEAFLVARLGEGKYRAFKILGFFDPYRSFWYIALLFLLCLSLVFCSLRRLGATLRLAFRGEIKRSEQDIESLGNTVRLTSTLSVEESIKQVTGRLRGKLYRVCVEMEGERGFLFAHRGGVSRLGSSLLHLGFVVAALGGLLISLFGSTSYRWAGAGDVIEVPEFGFQLRVDDFRIEYTEEGKVRDYLCTATVMEGDEELSSRIIEVNRPLRFRGISFFQSSYRADPTFVKEAVIGVLDRETRLTLARVTCSMGQVVPIPNSDYALQMVEFVGTFTKQGDVVFSDPFDEEFSNPAVHLHIYRHEEMIKRGWVFTPPYASFHSLMEDFDLELIEFEPLLQTGLQITRAPGTALVWVGLAMMTLGLLLAFGLSHRRIWAIVWPQNGGSEILLGGTASKNRLDFEREFQAVIAQIQGMR